MKVHLVCVQVKAYDAMIALYQRAEPALHELVDDAESADLILFVGGWRTGGGGVVDSPLPKRYPEKTFIYRDDDGFIPLLPGVYASAERPGWINLRRVEGAKYISALNPNIQPLTMEKKYLFSFAGGSTSILRKKLYKVKFRRPDVLIENTSNYYHWDPSQAGREERQRQYAAMIASSKFGLCPRGASAGSFRLYEVMEMGVAPVVISDKQLLPVGPDWESFAIRVPERQIGELDTILAGYEGESAERGRLAREAYEQWFAPPVVFNQIVGACERLRGERRVSERWVQACWGYMLWRRSAYDAVRGWGKAAILKVFRLLGKRFPYEMNTR